MLSQLSLTTLNVSYKNLDSIQEIEIHHENNIEYFTNKYKIEIESEKFVLSSKMLQSLYNDEYFSENLNYKNETHLEDEDVSLLPEAPNIYTLCITHL
jgi:hypothetical protein